MYDFDDDGDSSHVVVIGLLGLAFVALVAIAAGVLLSAAI